MLVGISGKIGSGKDTVGKIIQFLTTNDEEMLKWFEKEPNKALNEWNGNFNNLGKWDVKKFADTLKDIVCMLIGCTREQLEDQEFKNKELGPEWWYYKTPKGNISYEEYEKLRPLVFMEWEVKLVKPTPRLLLQIIGTECIRDKVHPNAWVNALFADYRSNGIAEKYLASRGQLVLENIYPNWIITDMRFPNEMEAVKSRGGITIRVNRPEYCPNCPMEDLTSQDCGDCVVYQDEIYQGLHESETALDNAKFDYTIENNGTIEELMEKVRQILIKEKIINGNS